MSDEKLSSIKKEWEIFKNDLKLDKVSNIQKVETKKAFYSGAFIVLGLILSINENKISDEEAVKYIDLLYDECEIFHNERIKFEKKLMEVKHFKIVCEKCKTIIDQCRCFSKDKVIIKDLCEKCKKIMC